MRPILKPFLSIVSSQHWALLCVSIAVVCWLADVIDALGVNVSVHLGCLPVKVTHTLFGLMCDAIVAGVRERFFHLSMAEMFNTLRLLYLTLGKVVISMNSLL